MEFGNKYNNRFFCGGDGMHKVFSQVNSKRELSPRICEKSGIKERGLTLKRSRRGKAKRMMKDWKAIVPCDEHNESFANEVIIHQLSNEQINVAWSISSQTIWLVSIYFEKSFEHFVEALRIYEVTGIEFDGRNAPYFREFIIRGRKGELTIDQLSSYHTYCVEVGIKLNDHEFFPLFRSRTVSAPEVFYDAAEGEKGKDCELSVIPKWREYVSAYSCYEKESDGWK
jgi:hypothetical protein